MLFAQKDFIPHLFRPVKGDHKADERVTELLESHVFLQGLYMVGCMFICFFPWCQLLATFPFGETECPLAAEERWRSACSIFENAEGLTTSASRAQWALFLNK